jgi:hypothetical protein
MKTIIGILIFISSWFSANAQSDPAAFNRDYLDDARRSLSGATGLSLVSLISQGAGYALIKTSMNNASTESTVGGLFLGIGGIGIETNTPILISRSYKQVKQWQCPQEDLLVKQKILNNIKAAKGVSLVRTVLPLAGIMVTSIAAYNNAEPATNEAIFFVFWAASLALSIPEIILIENSQSQIKSYQQKLKLGNTEQGLGMIYEF